MRCLKHAVWAILAALLFSATTVYASDFLDVNYVNCQRPYSWDCVPSNTFEDSDASGTYKILLDKENGCLYLAFFVYEQSAEKGADESDARITIDIESPAFTQKRFEFYNGEQPEEETQFHVITKSSAEFSRMDNAGQNVISGYLYAGFYFEKETERTVISVTANYSSGSDSKSIFSDVSLDMTCETDVTETQSAVQTETVVHNNNASENTKNGKYGTSDDAENVEDDGKTAEATKYTGKAVLSTTKSANTEYEDETKYSAAAGSEKQTSLPQAEENAANVDAASQNSSGLSNSSIALLCAASVLCAGGIGAVAAGVAAQAKKSAGKGDDKNE